MKETSRVFFGRNAPKIDPEIFIRECNFIRNQNLAVLFCDEHSDEQPRSAIFLGLVHPPDQR